MKKIFIFLFGGDYHRPRTFFRRILNFLLAILFPLKRHRDSVKEKIDKWSFNANEKKIKKFIGNYPHVKNESQTIKDIIKNSSSISRFGDGEFNICIGRSIGFQKYDPTLSRRLREILKSDTKKIIIGINTLPTIDKISPIWKKFIIRRGDRVSQLFKEKKVYGSSTITTIFPKNKKLLLDRTIELKKIWEKRNVVFVIGMNSRFFLCEDLFDNIKEYSFIYGPPKNAFSEYELILNKIMTYSTDWLIMLSLGPTATLLSYDLSNKGYQAIDIGHMPSKYHREKYGILYPENFKAQ